MGVATSTTLQFRVNQVHWHLYLSLKLWLTAF